MQKQVIDTANIGRQVPYSVGTASLRKFMRGSLAAVFATGLGMGVAHAGLHNHDTADHAPVGQGDVTEQTQKQVEKHAHQHINPDFYSKMTEKRVLAEINAVGEDSGMHMIPIFTDNFFTENSFDAEGLNKHLYEQFLEGVQNKLVENGQAEPSIEELKEKNIITPNEFNPFIEHIQGGSESSALFNVAAMRMNTSYGDEEYETCIINLGSRYIDREDYLYVGGIKPVGAGLKDVSIADIKNIEVNHELAHCLLLEASDDAHYGEVAADIYAIARQMQIHGSEATPAIEAYIDRRHLSHFHDEVHMGGGHTYHDTAIALESVLPELKKLADNNAFANLTPNDLVKTLYKEIPFLSERALTAELQQERSVRREAIHAIIYDDTDTNLVSSYGHYAAGENASLEVEGALEAYNTALTNISGFTPESPEPNQHERLAHYRDNLSDLRISLDEDDKEFKEALQFKRGLLIGQMQEMAEKYGGQGADINSVTGVVNRSGGLTFGEQYVEIERTLREVEMRIEQEQQPFSQEQSQNIELER